MQCLGILGRCVSRTKRDIALAVQNQKNDRDENHEMLSSNGRKRTSERKCLESQRSRRYEMQPIESDKHNETIT